MDMEPIVHPKFEPKTGTWQYIVACPSTKEAVIIDSVLDFDLEKQTISTTSAQTLLGVVKSEGYRVVRLLETHAHADHLTAAHYIQETLVGEGQSKPPICIGKRIHSVQQTFAAKYNVPDDELTHAFDHLFDDNDEFHVGKVMAKILHLPGHTPDHLGYMIGSNVFIGDSIFNPDIGSARCDFPGGDARALWSSMKELLSLPPDYKLYTGHDYPPVGDQGSSREPVPYVTVQEQKERNKHAHDEAKEHEFVKWRAERDEGLGEPRLLHQSLQVNIRGGRLPKRTHPKGVFLQFLVKVPHKF